MNVVLSIVVLAAFGLLGGAFFLWRKGGPLKQVLLMVLLAAIAIANVAIWTVPDDQGTAPIDKLEQVEQGGPRE